MQLIYTGEKMGLDEMIKPDFAKRAGSIVAILQGIKAGKIIEDRWMGKEEWEQIPGTELVKAQRRIVSGVPLIYKVSEAYLDCDLDAVLVRVDDRWIAESSAYYSGKAPKFSRTSLITAIAVDETGKVLMQGFQNPEAYQRTADERIMNYYSTSRNENWRKGDTSGCFQAVKKARISRDGLSAIYTVRQEGNEGACHVPGQYTCFFNKVI